MKKYNSKDKTPITEIIMCRHGNKANPNHLTGGWTDLDLSELGVKQAEILGNRLLKEFAPFDIAFSSHLKRAYRTCDIVCKKLNMTFSMHEELSEMNYGDFKDKTDYEWKLKYPELANSIWNAHTKFPNGESEFEFLKRVADFFDKIVNENCGKKILIIAHGGSLHAILRHLSKFPLDNRNGLIFCHNETAIDRIQIKDNEVKILSVNDTFHLI